MGWFIHLVQHMGFLLQAEDANEHVSSVEKLVPLLTPRYLYSHFHTTCVPCAKSNPQTERQTPKEHLR